jgi:predicted unusual protein kinase regulating ubiquinone biosynthesis (AarF/ABC1/UbiB family)
MQLNGNSNKNNNNMASLASTATIAAAAVSAAVSMKKLEAPDDGGKTYIVKDEARQGLVDEDGLPVVYDRQLIEAYWRKEDGALQQRWREFLGVSVPFLTRIVTLLVRGGAEELKKNEAELAREARINLEKLGPTYIKAGQMMSVRPDVLPQAALDELAVLQDSVKPFETSVAVASIEKELGGPLGQFFTEISEEPVAAASLAQVYKATLLNGKTVAVKVQRPNVLSVVSKDLYVLRRAAEVYQGLMDRFAPQQKTNYVALFNEWAIGFYTELDFTNEAANQAKLKRLAHHSQKYFF